MLSMLLIRQLPQYHSWSHLRVRGHFGDKIKTSLSGVQVPGDPNLLARRIACAAFYAMGGL
jgi:hypothetical protein